MTTHTHAHAHLPDRRKRKNTLILRYKAGGDTSCGYCRGMEKRKEMLVEKGKKKMVSGPALTFFGWERIDSILSGAEDGAG